MAQTYKFGNGTWATKEGSTLAYNDEDNNFKPLPFSFERDSIATRVNKEGLIEVVGNNIPRIDYTDSSEGALLLENSATNYDSESENFSTSFMSNSIGIQSSSLVSETSPSGDNNSVYKITKVTDNSDPYVGRSGVNFTSTKIAFSVWLWTDEDQPKDVMILIYRDGVQEVETKNITLTTTPTRYFIEKTFSNTPSNVSYRIDLSQNNSNQYIYAWGKQLESGNLSSYIPTNGSTVQRAAETANGSGNSEVFNDSEGVLFADISALANDSTGRKITLNNGSNSQVLVLEYTSTVNQIRVFLSNGSLQFNEYITISDLTNFNKIAIKYKVNNFAIWVNGLELAKDLIGTTFSSGTLTNLNFDDGSGNADFYGNTKEIGYYDTALTDAELEYMTSYRSLNEMVTELNLNTL